MHIWTIKNYLEISIIPAWVKDQIFKAKITYDSFSFFKIKCFWFCFQIKLRILDEYKNLK